MLSPRQLQVLKLIADGHKHRVIGQMLGLSMKTVSEHARQAYKKLKLTRCNRPNRFKKVKKFVEGLSDL